MRSKKHTKLNQSQLDEIAMLAKTLTEVAAHFNMSKTTFKLIRKEQPEIDQIYYHHYEQRHSRVYTKEDVLEIEKLATTLNIEAMRRCKQALIIDKGQDYVHTKLILWYSDAKVPLEQKKMLEQLIVDNLPKEDTDKIMKTIADTYIEEGIAIGEARGVTKGATNKVIEIAGRMLQEKTDIKFISSVTGLSNDDILKLRNKM